MEEIKKTYEHDFDKKETCKKCHKHIKLTYSNVCPVIGREEVDKFRDYDER